MVKQLAKNALHFDLDVYFGEFWLVERWFTNAMNLDLGVHSESLGWSNCRLDVQTMG